MSSTVTGKRGLALAMVIMAALLTAIAAYAILLVATSQAKQGRFNVDRTRTRHAAEAGLVWAQQRLLATPTLEDPTPSMWSSAQGGAPDVTIDGVQVDIILDACVQVGGDPCPTRKLTAKVIY